VLPYADAVHQETLIWLRELRDDDLDWITDAKKYLAPYPEYQTPGFRAGTDGHLGEPVWTLLMRPCVGHIQRHLGELMIIKDVMRGSD
jgi:hypothetical protein